MKPVLHVGIDVGSTTVKIAVLSPHLKLLFGRYVRHMSDIRKATMNLLEEMQKSFSGYRITAAISGSGGMGLARFMELPFYQEILAETKAVRAFNPEADAIVELGGEDEKVTYLKNGVDQRMNGACAGGTGAFIDRMAALLSTDAAGLGRLAAESKQIYPIASRCGVFAKTDIQALLNEGAPKEDIAASVFQSVVNQTISGLTCGRPLRGKIVFLGGPLTFQPVLRERFRVTLGMKEEDMIVPEHGELYVAIGAALTAMHDKPFDFDPWLERIRQTDVSNLDAVKCLEPLFASDEEYEAFKARHARFHVDRLPLSEASGPCWLGIDAGSTTIKTVLLDAQGRILYEYYGNNRGNPLNGAKAIIADLYSKLPAGARICGAGVTGYGENLLREALSADTGEVETMAHYRAARHFCPDVTTVLDIGGQDMKCCRLKDGAVDSILLNEACSSGCGSFLDTFAQSLGMDIRTFSKIALTAAHPVDLGSRCTVFMNSRVREAQKNGVSVADISAGLSYSVIKNALYKVVRLRDVSELGDKVVVQGGTFYNDAVLRALEKLLGRDVVRPNIAGLMGAYGMALITKDRCPETHRSTLVTPEELEKITMKTDVHRCPGCGNHCLVTVTTFSDGRAFVSGNRCERGASLALTGKASARSSLPNIYQWKYDRLFSYRPLSPGKAPRGTVGIPRALNMYEEYPFWFTFFTKLGFRVVLSSADIRQIPITALETIPSYSECYPVKLVHAHIADLIRRKPDFIWYPCIDHGPDEKNENSYMCPMVTSYPETIAANMDDLFQEAGIPFLHPFLPLYESSALQKRLVEELAPLHIPYGDIFQALTAARAEMEKYKADLLDETRRILKEIKEKHLVGIVLAGRPYHVDPAANHGIPDLVNQLGMAVLSEDGVAMLGCLPNLRVLNQWTWHGRLYRAADYVTRHANLELVELNSFGCGLDAVVTDQVQEIMTYRGRLYTSLKIDEGLNLGAVRIRLRSLKAAIQERMQQDRDDVPDLPYENAPFTKEMKKDYTILVPEMSPIHFPIIEAAGRGAGYRLKVLPPVREDIDTGLSYVNNDACYPAIITIGSLIRALQSGDYDLSRTAVMLSQTGGACRASNYLAFLQRALKEAGLSGVPVISANMEGLAPQPGFQITMTLAQRLIMATIYGDALMQCLYRTRPYEKVPGSAETLCSEWQQRCSEALLHGQSYHSYGKMLARIISDFDHLPLLETERRPRIGIVGEIYVKFSPIASNDLARAIEENGGEAEASGILDFFLYSLLDSRFQRKYLGGSMMRDLRDTFIRRLLEWYRRPYEKALKHSRRFHPITPIEALAKRTAQYLSLGHRAGEGWFLTADMIDLLGHGCRGIVCLQPFACLPNHITGEGMAHKLHIAYPEAVFLSLDCDASVSQVNQINRLKLMMNALTEKTPVTETQSILRKTISAKKGSAL